MDERKRDFIAYANIIAESWGVVLSESQMERLYHIAKIGGLFKKIEKINSFFGHSQFLILESWVEEKIEKGKISGTFPKK